MIKIYTIVTAILLIEYCILINDFKRCHHRLYLAKSRQCLLRPGNKTLLGLFTFALSLSVTSRRQEIDFHDITLFGSNRRWCDIPYFSLQNWSLGQTNSLKMEVSHFIVSYYHAYLCRYRFKCNIVILGFIVPAL